MGYDAIEFKYGVTPPANQRDRRRNKEKARSLKRKEEKVSYSVEKAMFNTTEPISSGVIDDVTIQIDTIAESPPEVPSISSPQYKKKNPKSIKTLRSQERDYKNTSNLPQVDTNHLPTPVQSIKIDSPNRYYSLHSKQVVPSAYEDEVSDILTVRRKHPTTPVECPKDRLDFCRIFSQLISMGNSARREKKEKTASPYVRQLSSEQEVWQNRLNDLIWLELQAWMSFRTMEEQDAYLMEAQRQVVGVLEEVMTLKVDLPRGPCCHKGSVKPDQQGRRSLMTHMEDVFQPEDSIIVEVTNGTPQKIRLTPAKEQPDCDCDTNPTSIANLELSVEAQNVALQQVGDLLERLEKAESLYPTTKALGKAHSMYASDEFQRRVKTLCVWMNVTKDLAHKLHVMAKMLNIDQMEGVSWPWLDLEGTTQLLRNIRDPQNMITPEVPEGGDYHGNQSHHGGSMEVLQEDNTSSSRLLRSDEKNVKFDVSDTNRSRDATLTLTPSDTSTPVKSPSRKGSLYLSQASSSMSMEELTEHSIYRYYADRMLKKLGLRKMLDRLKRIAHGTLHRARQGLVKPPSRLSYADVTSKKQEVKQNRMKPVTYVFR